MFQLKWMYNLFQYSSLSYIYLSQNTQWNLLLNIFSWNLTECLGDKIYGFLEYFLFTEYIFEPNVF